MDDGRIKELLFGRDESALGIIQSLYGNLIKSVAFNLFHSDSVAEECLNDTLLDVWNTIPPKDPKSVSSYACMIVRRRAIDRLRQETAQKRARPEGSGYTDVMDDVSFMDDIAEDVVDKMELGRLINEYLGTLSRTNREIFIGRYHDFEPVESIALRLGLSQNSVNIRLTRMKMGLKSKMEKGGIAL